MHSRSPGGTRRGADAGRARIGCRPPGSPAGPTPPPWPARTDRRLKAAPTSRELWRQWQSTRQQRAGFRSADVDFSDQPPASQRCVSQLTRSSIGDLNVTVSCLLQSLLLKSTNFPSPTVTTEARGGAFCVRHLDVG